MKRRTFIKKTSAGALSAGLIHKLEYPATRLTNTISDITVIGAGVFGVWTAFYLQTMGVEVTLIDAYGPGNSRSSSGGETRILRSDYGQKHHYTKMNIRAHQLWAQWQDEWKAQLMLSTGRVTFYDESSRKSILSTLRFLRKNGVEGEILTSEEIQYRWPQIKTERIDFGVYYPGGAGGSALMAREACRVVAEKFVKAGGKLVVDKVSVRQGSGRFQVMLKDGTSLSSENYLFACGPWMGRIFPELLKDRLKVYRRDVFFVGTPPGDHSFTHPNLPIWSFNNAEDRRFYGLPNIQGRGVKVAPWPDMNSIDMDRDDRFNNMMEIKQIREFLNRRFPGLKDQPFLEGRVCQLTFGKDEEFIIDRHPEYQHVWLACAGSGHAFKHGPALGEYIADRMINDTNRYSGHFQL